MPTPYIGFSNETLSKQRDVNEGDVIHCPHCNGEHELECGLELGRKTNLLMFFRCSEKQYLGAVNRKAVVGVKSDVSGKV